jgi:cytoskeletal protein RodZ
MSLINDALKRAKEAQQQKPPADSPGGPPLRPVEPRPSHGNNLWLMLAFALLVAVAAILLWQWFLQSRQPQTIAAKPPSSTQTLPTPKPTLATPILETPAVEPSERPHSVAEAKRIGAGVRPATKSESATPTPVTSPPVQAVESTTSPAGEAVPVPTTNAQGPALAAENAPPPEAAPKPAPLKLQGIIFHPTRPSVVINGKLLFVGDPLGEWRVMAIDSRSVTLVGAGKTNVLTLE